MIASRRNPRPARWSSLTNTPSASGPRCSRRSRIATTVCTSTGVPSNVNSPQMPHTSLPPHSKTALHERVQRVNTVGPPDLLPLIDAARTIADRHFDDPLAGQKHLGRQFRLEVESDAPEPDTPEHVTTKDLVRRVHV